MPIGSSPAPPLAGTWSRLHPLSPVARIVISLGVVLAVGIPSLAERQSSSGPAVDPLVVAAVAVLVVTTGVVSWLVTRWRVVGDELQIDTGLIFRQSLRFPLRRIQAVDVVAPLTARILGLAEVRVISAGTGHHQHGRLAYLSNQDATAVRAQLLALAHGLAAETPEPPARPLFQVDNGRLIVASLLRGTWLLLLLFLLFVGVAATLTAVNATGAGGVAGQDGSETVASLLGGALSGLLALGIDAARTVNGDFDFTIGEAPDGLRLHRGLLQKRHETIPYGRIQAVRLIQPLLWRPFGWARVELDVARQPEARRQGEARQLAHLLAPVATLDQARWLIGRIAPGAPAPLTRSGAPPRRAAIRAPLSYHYLSAWHDERWLVTQTGRVRPATVIVPLEKAQSIRLSSGPVLRALHLANLRVDTAGRRWVAAALCRDDDEATVLVDRLGGLARRARRLSW
jgi:putative membrane protein